MKYTLTLAALSALIAMPAVAGPAHAGSLFPGLDRPKPEPLYTVGDYVEFKLTEERAQVIGTRCNPGVRECAYLVRLPKCGNAEWMGRYEITLWTRSLEQ